MIPRSRRNLFSFGENDNAGTKAYMTGWACKEYGGRGTGAVERVQRGGRVQVCLPLVFQVGVFASAWCGRLPEWMRLGLFWTLLQSSSSELFEFLYIRGVSRSNHELEVFRPINDDHQSDPPPAAPCKIANRTPRERLLGPISGGPRFVKLIPRWRQLPRGPGSCPSASRSPPPLPPRLPSPCGRPAAPREGMLPAWFPCARRRRP